MTQTQMTRQQILDMQDDRHRLLTARVRELETQLAANNPLLDEAANRLDELEQQLAASQAYAEQLLEALDRVRSGAAALGLDRIFDIATEALALPRDTSALDAYVSDKVKEAMK